MQNATTRNESGLTTTKVKVPPIRVDRTALDALRAAARTAVESAEGTAVPNQHGLDKALVTFSAVFKRKNRETVEIDGDDLDTLNEPVRSTNWSIRATPRSSLLEDNTIRLHACEGRARLKVTSRDGAWRRATIASILEVAGAYPPPCRGLHHWTARTATGIVAAAATAGGSLLAPSGLHAAVDIGLAAACGTIYGCWAIWGHGMVSKRYSHVLVLAPVDRHEDDDA